MINKLVIGIGGAGCYLANQIQSKFPCRSMAIEKTGNFAESYNFNHKLEISEEDYKNTHLNESYKTALLENIQKYLQDSSMLVLTAGLGGYLGTTMTIEVAKLAKSMGIKTIGVVYMPFAFETPRHEVSAKALTDLRTYVDELVIHDHATQLPLEPSKSKTLLNYFIEAGESMVNQLNNKLSGCNA